MRPVQSQSQSYWFTTHMKNLVVPWGMNTENHHFIKKTSILPLPPKNTQQSKVGTHRINNLITDWPGRVSHHSHHYSFNKEKLSGNDMSRRRRRKLRYVCIVVEMREFLVLKFAVMKINKWYKRFVIMIMVVIMVMVMIMIVEKAWIELRCDEMNSQKRKLDILFIWVHMINLFFPQEFHI